MWLGVERVRLPCKEGSGLVCVADPHASVPIHEEQNEVCLDGSSRAPGDAKNAGLGLQ